MGGYDVFVARINNDQQWTTPVNIGYPLNTTDDDLFLYPWNNASVFFASRIQNDGFGKEDLFAAQLGGDKELNEIIASFIGEPAAVVAPNKIETGSEEVIDETGKTAVVESPSKKPVEEAVSAPREVLIDPVYFAFDHFLLNESGKKQLEQVAQLLKENPSARAKLIGHADAKGQAEYNMKLSVKRALTAYNYLISLGIAPERVERTGVGENDFAAINMNPDGSDNPEGRKLNRRVSFEIIGINSNYVLIRVSPIPEHLKIKN
jgi:outer membrane protein OmpA-like peptidoglycan-associated protein